MDESNELTTLLNMRNQLQIGFKKNTVDLATAFHKAGLIDDNCYETVTQAASLLTPSQKAVEIVKNVIDSVKLSEASYRVMMGILAANSRIYGTLVEKLDEEYKRQEKLRPTQTTTTPSEASGSTSQGSSEPGILDEDDQADVEEALENVQGRWRKIGTQLHVKTGRLEEFRTQNLESADAMGMVVLEYLKRNYNVEKFGAPTWMKIVDAVRKPAGGNNNAEADKIAKKYIGQ